MSSFVRVLFWLCACSAGATCASETGSADYFADPGVSWPVNPGYKASYADGVETLHVGKQVMWAGQQMHLAHPCDMSAHPYLTVQLKTSQPMVLDLYVISGKSAANLPRRIRAVEDFQTYGYDFSNQKGLDPKNITGFIFCVNGAANSWEGVVQMKQLMVGDQATLLPDIEAVEDQEWYHDTGSHSALLTGIDHVRQMHLSGAEKLLQNVAFTPITGGRCHMTYDLIPGASGTATALLTVEGEQGYGSATRTFGLVVEPNLPPTIDQHPPVTAQVGKELTVRFSGVSDGNYTADQPLTLSLASSNAAVLSGQQLRAENPNGGRYIFVRGTPTAPGDTTLTLTLDDRAGGKSVTSTSVNIHAVTNWNQPPTLDPIADQNGFVSAGAQEVILTGIGDGDNNTQHLTVTAASSDPRVVPDPSVVYHQGGSATLQYSPLAKPGIARITVTVSDDGGTADNNGNQSVSQSFSLTTRVRPVTSYTAPTDFTQLKPFLRAEDAVSVSADSDGGSPVLKITCKDKPTFGGLWLKLPDMDLSQAPYLSVDVACDQKIAFNMYFYDGSSQRNRGAPTHIGGPGTTWKTVTFDFSGKDQMATEKSVPINGHWITTVLFNFHPAFSWPFSNWSGTILMRNLRIGTSADVPKRNPQVTMDAIPSQVLKQGSGKTRLVISGLSVANQQAISLAVTENGTTTVVPSVAAIKNGSAELEITASTSGRSTVTVSASAPQADAKSVSFTVDVIDPSTPSTLQLDPAKTFQTIRGFGTFFGPDVELYTKELGASAIRIGDECEFNPRRDTSDLSVLNRDRLNYKAFDFGYFRRMKAAGVETFFFTAWTPPAWQKTNFSTNFQAGAGSGSSDACPNRLDFGYYDDYAKTLVALIRMFQEEADITFDAISLQNEPCFCEPYGSAILDPPHMIRLIDIVGPRFAKEGIPTRILMPEQVFTQGNMLEFIRVLNADPEAQKYCDIVATHGYDDKGVKAASPDFPAWSAMFNLAQKGTVAKELWMSETYPEFRNWSSAMNYSMTLYGSLEYGNISLWTQWEIEGTLLSHNIPTDSFWVVRQYWKYIRPGAKRISSVSADTSVFATSYLNDQKHGGKLVSVLTNHKAAPAILSLAVTGRDVAGWQVITTDPVRHGLITGELKKGEVLLLPPNSITTVIER